MWNTGDIYWKKLNTGQGINLVCEFQFKPLLREKGSKSTQVVLQWCPQRKKKLICFNAFDLLNKLSFSRVEHLIHVLIPNTMWKTPTACNLVIMWSVLNKENWDNGTQEMLKEFCESTPRKSLHWRWKKLFLRSNMLLCNSVFLTCIFLVI